MDAREKLDNFSPLNNKFRVIEKLFIEYEPFHKIFMDMNKLEIYCFECNIEITDLMEYIFRYFSKNAYLLRSLALEEDK